MDETRRITFFNKSKYGPTGKPRFKFPKPPSDRKEVMEEREKYQERKRLKERQEFIEKRKREARSGKRPKEQRFQDGGMTSKNKNKVKKVIKGLNKASKTHAKQAKTLSTVITAKNGILVRGTGAQVKKTTFKGSF